MNQQKLKYCMKRAEDIYYDNREKLKDKYRIPEVKLSTYEKSELIRSGKVNLKSRKELGKLSDGWGYHQELSVIFDFSKHENPAGMKPEYEKAKEKLKIQYQTLLDELVLGDEDEAKKLLEAFSK